MEENTQNGEKDLSLSRFALAFLPCESIYKTAVQFFCDRVDAPPGWNHTGSPPCDGDSLPKKEIQYFMDICCLWSSHVHYLHGQISPESPGAG